jgi:DNA ligase-1
MAKQHFLQQAQTYDASKHDIIGYFASEKLDGIRCFWDGGVSRGKPTTEIPWANTAKDKKQFIATGLWSRYGKAIFAPDWFLNQLPNFPLDGELWAGRKQFQLTKSIVSTHIPTERWKQIKFMVFDSPSLKYVMRDRIIEIPNFSKRLRGVDNWLKQQCYYELHGKTYQDIYKELYITLLPTSNLELLQQLVITKDNMATFASSLVAANAEGAVYRNPDASYVTERTYALLKDKPELDDEATVIGYYAGRATDKGSKLLGLMGALLVEWKGKQFKLSGFTDQERVLSSDGIITGTTYAELYAASCPGELLPNTIYAINFPRRSKVTFCYRELTDAGVPKEARFLRKYEAL